MIFYIVYFLLLKGESLTATKSVIYLSRAKIGHNNLYFLNSEIILDYIER
jgi:hypothetical protein